jgi:hypothetical protein
MEDYKVVDVEDNKVGEAVGRQDGYLIIETGTLRKTRHAVPDDTAHVDESENVVRLTISKAMVEEGPTIGDDETDWGQVEDYYGRSPSMEGQTGGVQEDPEAARARMRENELHQPDTQMPPQKGSVGIHQDRWETTE